MNLLREYGYSQEQIQEKFKRIWGSIFEDRQKLYHESNDIAYIVDSEFGDIRAEAIGFGMMACLQNNKQSMFNKLWNFAYTKMYISEGEYQGHFHFGLTKKFELEMDLPRPDAELFFAISLYFAFHRWGNGEGIYNYEKQASDILYKAIHSKHTLFNTETYLPRNYMDSNNIDVSFLMPQYFYLFSMFVDLKDAEFWGKAAVASRNCLINACHPITGLAAEHMSIDGTPLGVRNHGTFFNHSYFVPMTIALYSLWNGDVPEFTNIVRRMLYFFDKKKVEDIQDYLIDGTSRRKKADHPVALCATLAQSVVVLERSPSAMTEREKEIARRAIERFWNLDPVKERYRYYDNFLYLFSFATLIGEFKVY